ncbi:unnamed protein product, partial [Mesorhabditis belari]|uniref:Ephrin RBD domain-containing protein n=1 Tax=Mesorhabditis belari TaxID=2138241 RepID=A0AAF3FMD4_9BILA
MKMKAFYCTLYQKVKKPCFESCFIGDESELIVNCSSSFAHFSHLKIHSTKTVKVDFEEEERDSTLYFLTTSTGEFDGLDNEIFGLCHERNLRISVEVQRKDRLHNRHRHHSGLHWREENGVGSWKKNVFHRKALEPFESREVEEEPIEDERVNRIQNVMSGQMHLMPPDVRELPDNSLRLPSG